ncbi:MAG TPA: DsrE family protein [Nitrospiraceae bacterium]|nr:DsrE family protein [Nitrospiraceae bacterium]
MNAILVTLLVGVLGVSIVGLSGAAEMSQDPHRVVMHVNSSDEKVQRGALNNIRHLYQEMGREHVQVELVVHGAGLIMLTKKDSTLATELAQLKTAYDVEFTACSNTMKAMNLTVRDLVEQVDRTVPAMVRLVELQEQGWVYIKP